MTFVWAQPWATWFTLVTFISSTKKTKRLTEKPKNCLIVNPESQEVTRPKYSYISEYNPHLNELAFFLIELNFLNFNTKFYKTLNQVESKI